MLYANVTVTIFNARPGSDRRDTFYPTVIRGAAFYEAVEGTGGPSQERTEKYWIRIPEDAEVQDGRVYIDAGQYRLLPEEDISGYWTVQTGDYVTEGAVEETPAERDIRKYLHDAGMKLIQVVSFADNTKRGSPIMRHWRIGGA